MTERSDRAMLERLKRFDTPSITNVVATYPAIRFVLVCMSPGGKAGTRISRCTAFILNWGAIVGYAVTCLAAG